MNKLLFLLILTISYHLKAQEKTEQNEQSDEFRPGVTKKYLRALYESQPQNFKIIFETDTLDSYSFQGIERINCFYKNDTCYKMQQIITFDHREIKNIAHDPSWKKIARNTWIKKDGRVMSKITFDESKDLSTMEGTVMDGKE